MKIQYQSDKMLELLSSFLRWIFLLFFIILGLFFQTEMPWSFSRIQFYSLLTFGFLYMGIAEYILRVYSIKSRVYHWITHSEIFFNYGAFIWLIFLTGGSESPLFPIGFLLILHASVYWKLKGGLITALFVIVGYTILLLILNYSFSGILFIYYLIDIVFVISIAMLGGIIVYRERKFLSEKRHFEDLAKKDFLTNLYNHRTFQEKLRNAINTDTPFMLILADIDHFKEINDKYGHVTGDEVLRRLGKIFRKGLTKTNAEVFRYGGEEFALLIYTNNVNHAHQTLIDIKLTIEQSVFSIRGNDIKFTMSFGAVPHTSEDTPTDLADLADKCLYCAKRNGRNQIMWKSSNNCSL